MSDDLKLKSCPFCGNNGEQMLEPKSIWGEPQVFEDRDLFGCSYCNVWSYSAEGWNTRDEPAPLVWSSERPTVAGWYWIEHVDGWRRIWDID